MYGVHIRFTDGTKSFCRFHMNRQEYNEVMRSWQKDYRIEVENVVEEDGVRGDRMIYAVGNRKQKDEGIKSVEVAKSRARYYSRTNGRIRESRGKRSGVES